VELVATDKKGAFIWMKVYYWVFFSGKFLCTYVDS